MRRTASRCADFSRNLFFFFFFFSKLNQIVRLGGTWGLLEGAERLGCENPSTSKRTPSSLTLVGERLEDDAVFKGPAEPLGALLEGAAEPLDAILWGLAEPLEAVLVGSAEPLSVSEEHLADSHGTRASADTVLDFPEKTWVPVDTDLDPPEECTLDSVVLSGRSGEKPQKRLKMSDIQQIWTVFWWRRQWRSLTSRDHSWHLGFNQLSGFLKGYAFLNADTLNLLLLLPDRAIFSLWSVGTIPIRAQLGSVTLTFMLIFSAIRTLLSNLATLARVAKFVAVEATHRVGNKQGHLHL